MSWLTSADNFPCPDDFKSFLSSQGICDGATLLDMNDNDELKDIAIPSEHAAYKSLLRRLVKYQKELLSDNSTATAPAPVVATTTASAAAASTSPQTSNTTTTTTTASSGGSNNSNNAAPSSPVHIKSVSFGAPHIKLLRKTRSDGKFEFVIQKTIADKLRGERELEHRNICVNEHLRHPNVLKYYYESKKHSDSKTEIMMEYADCDTLDVALGNIVDLKTRQLISKAVARQIFTGAAYYYLIHNRVNRDSKPSNYYLSRNGCIKLADFDISRTLSDNNNNTPSSPTTQQQQQAVGTPDRQQSSSMSGSLNVGGGMQQVHSSSSSPGGDGMMAHHTSSPPQQAAPTPSVSGLTRRRTVNRQSSSSSAGGSQQQLPPPKVVIDYTCIGTTGYAAPEIRSGQTRKIIPDKCEAWSVAASLYALLESTGEAPFARFNLESLEAQKQEKHVDKLPWNEVVPDDPALSYLLKRCLTVDVEKRCGLVEALAITHVVQNNNSSSEQQQNANNDNIWLNSFVSNPSENMNIKNAKSVGIDKTCDEILKECQCSPSDPEIDTKVKKATLALQAEFNSWKKARSEILNNSSSDEKKWAMCDGSMIKLQRDDRGAKSYAALKPFAIPAYPDEVLNSDC